jgi:hypothetical protein
MLAIWAGLVLVGFALVGGFLGSALSSEGDVTSNPESKQAEELIDERFPQRDPVDELVVVRSDALTASAQAFRASPAGSGGRRARAKRRPYL